MNVVGRKKSISAFRAKIWEENESKRELPSVLGIDNAEYSNVDVANTNVLREYKLGITRYVRETRNTRNSEILAASVYGM